MVEDLEKLCSRMETIRALLTDAEEKGIREFSIKHWLDELRDVACNAEDVVEESKYEVLCYKLVCEEQHDSTKHEESQFVKRQHKVNDSIIPPPCAPLHDALFQRQILVKINKINGMFEEIYEEVEKLGVEQKIGHIDVSRPLRMSSRSFLNEQEVSNIVESC